MTTKEPIGIELFCGCGGTSTGFLDAGIRIAAGFDLDKRAIGAFNFNHNHRCSRGFAVDLSVASGAQLLSMAGLDDVDLVIGGPPCQPFSVVGRRRGADDARASLLQDFARIVGELQPSAILFENVPNLQRIGEGTILEQFMQRLAEFGYSLRCAVLSAADYGVAQTRRRLIIVGAKGMDASVLPKPTHGPPDLLEPGRQPYVTAQAALGDLPDAAEYGECGVFNHEPTEHTLQMRARFASLRPGARERGSFHDRLHPDRPGYTLRAGTGNFSPLRPVHYRYDRVITVRESARLQGFDDSFIWPDWIPRLQQYRQIGNAVPPPLAKAIALAMAEHLRWPTRPERLMGDVSSRPSPISLTDEQRRAQRLSRIRGASLGARSLGRSAISESAAE